MARKLKKGEYTIVEPSYSITYTLGPGYAPIVRHPLTSPTEIRDISAAIIALTAAFYLILHGPNGSDALYYLGLSALSVVAGFLVHEMSHKFVARRYGCWAEFRASYQMLGLAIITSFFRFLFAAPGAVMIAGNVDKERNGKISLAGPASNLIIAAICIAAAYLTSGTGFVFKALVGLSFFSVFLGGFNMIPIMPFDGAKIWHWSKPVYAVTLVAAGLLYLLTPSF